jgi:hypothetical protein
MPCKIKKENQLTAKKDFEIGQTHKGFKYSKN